MGTSIALGKPTTLNTLDRDALKAKRLAMTPFERTRASASICAHIEALLTDPAMAGQIGAPPIVAGFWPLAGEPDLRSGLSAWTRKPGWRLALPCVVASAHPLSFHLWTPETPMHPGRYGIPEPQSTEAVLPTVVLLPGLGFTRFGDRIGYGGGFYDRTLGQWQEEGRVVLKVGVMFACSEIEAIGYRPQAHDQALDWVVTENETLRAQRRDG